MKITKKLRPFITTRLLWTGIGLSVFYWFLESATGAFIFHKGGLIEQTFPKDPERLFTRLLIISLFAIFGFYAQVIINEINKRNQNQEELKGLNEDLELRIIDLTERLKEVNKSLEENKIRQAQAECRNVFQHAVNRILAGSSTVDEIISKIIRAVCEDWGWATGEFWTLDRQANQLRYVEIRNSLPVDFSEFERSTLGFTFGPGVGLPGRIWATCEPAWIVDVTKDANFLRGTYAAKIGLHSALGFPIAFGKKIIGVMTFFSREVRQPDPELLNLYVGIGSRIGEFIEHKRATEI